MTESIERQNSHVSTQQDEPNKLLRKSLKTLIDNGTIKRTLDKMLLNEK